MLSIRLTLLIIYLASSTAYAGEVEVVNATAKQTGNDVYRFEVTLRHADSGWDHYADRWEVLGPDGSVLGTRVLYHPHVDEQPFTRSLSGVKVPATMTTVEIQAHDSVHGHADQKFKLELGKP